MKPVVYFFFVVIFSFPMLGNAELEVNADSLSQEELAIQEKARKRLYPGGRDEEDLKVLSSATVAVRKVQKRDLDREVYKQLFNEDLKESAEGSEENSEDLED